MNEAVVCISVKKQWPDGAFGLRDVSFHAEQGTITAFVGRNGSGKTTLLRVIAGLTPHAEGTISNPFGSPGILFQEPSLWPHLTVLDQLLVPLRIVRHLSDDEARTVAMVLLNRFNISLLSNRYPSQLSGGQQQKVTLARLLSVEPKVLCLDEVTSALDPFAKADIYRIIGELKSEGRIVLISTHDLHYARRHADQIIYLVDGSIAMKGSPQEVMLSNKDPFFEILR